MFKRHFQLHRLALPLNSKRQNVAGVGMRADQIREFDLAIKWIDKIAVLIDLVISDGSHNVARLDPGFRRRHVRLDIRDVNAASFTRLPGVLAQLRIARWENRKTDCWKSAVLLALGFLEEVRDDRGRDCVDELR